MKLLQQLLRWATLAAGAIGAAVVCTAQERDTQLWAEVDIEIPVVKRLAFIGTQEFRLRDDVTELSLYRTEVGIEYKLLSFWKIGTVYRLDVKSDEIEHTAHISSAVKADVGPIEFSWRLRFQRDFFPDGSPEDAIRNKFSIDFENAGQITPYIASEVYYYADGNTGFNRYRWYGGLKRDIDKHSSVELYYLMQREIGGKETEITTVLGLGYSFAF